MKKRCIILYKGFPKYSKLNELSETKKQRISEANKDPKTPGGEHQHKDQCDGISEAFADSHCIHLELCNKKLTLLLAGKASQQHSVEQRRLSRRSAGETSTACTIPMSLTSAKKGEYSIMGPKLAQLKSHRFRPKRPLMLQEKLRIRRCTKKLNTLIL